MEGSAKNTERSDRSKSRTSRQKKRIEEAHNYLAANVDPIMSQLITYLMVDQPEDVSLAMVDYLRKLQAGEPLPVEAGAAAARQAERKDRVYMAREVSPLLMKLMNRLIVARPVPVVPFLLEQLEGMLGMEEDGDDAASVTLQTSLAKMEDGPATCRSSTQLAGAAPPEAFALPPGTPGKGKGKGEGGPGEGAAVGAVGAGGEGGEGGEGAVAAPAAEPPPAGEGGGAAAPGTARATEEPAQAAAPVPPKPQTIILLVIGIDGAGKTTLLRTLQGDMDSQTKPSHGFKHVTMVLDEHRKVKFYDLGGNPKIRGIWKNYFHDVHGVVYLVDGHTPDRYEEAVEQYKSTFEHKYLQDKPRLVLVTKEDLGWAKPGGPDAVAADLGAANGEDLQISGLVARGANSGGAPDPRLDEALGWLLGRVGGDPARWGALEARVAADTQDMQEEFQRQKFEKNKRIFKNLLEQAFPKEGTEKENVMTEEEGIDFLAAEIGVEAASLPDIARQICALCGYQTLALQMVGGMKVPISKKNKTWEWEEILEYVEERRKEAGVE